MGKEERHNYFSGALLRNRRPESYYLERTSEALELELKTDRFLAYALPIGALTGAYFYAEGKGLLPKTPFQPDYTALRHIAACFSAGSLLSSLSRQGARRTRHLLERARAPESALAIAESREAVQAFTAKDLAQAVDTGYDALANLAGFYLGVGYSRAVEDHFSRLALEYSALYQKPILGLGGPESQE